MNKYLIIYNYDVNATILAVSTYDCIKKFAEYRHNCSYLFEKAINGLGLGDELDFVRMYEFFSSDTINAIHIIDKTVYDAEDNK